VRLAHLAPVENEFADMMEGARDILGTSGSGKSAESIPKSAPWFNNSAMC